MERHTRSFGTDALAEQWQDVELEVVSREESEPALCGVRIEYALGLEDPLELRHR